MSFSQYNVFQQKTSCKVATVTNITGIYSNGPSNNGVGATLTITAAGPLVIDSITLDINDRFLLGNQTNSNENGIYIYNGNNGLNLPVAQRSADMQSIEQLTPGQFIMIEAGSLMGATFVVANPLPQNFGVSNFVITSPTTSGGSFDINALPPALASQLTDFIPAFQAGITVKETVQQINDVIGQNLGITNSLVGGVLIGEGNNPVNSIQLDVGQTTVGQGIGLDPVAMGIGTVAINSINTQTFTVNGSFTYIPNPKTVFVIVTALGAGGAGGGTSPGGAGTAAAGGGGGAGGYSQRALPITDIGASQPVVIGAAGLGAVAANGNPGGDTMLGLAGNLVLAQGGQGGISSTGNSGFVATDGGLPGIGVGISSINGAGTAGSNGFSVGSATFGTGGGGGDSFLGGGGLATTIEGDGNSSTGSGSGGAGSISFVGTFQGGNGGDGYMSIAEFLSL